MAQIYCILCIAFGIFWLSQNNNGMVHASDSSVLLETLTRQVMLQQFFTEQRVRSEGQSGVKINRQRRSGYRNYFTESHNGYAACAIHDHANNIRTVGLGELLAVLNGIEFQTRHNDYRLFMPHRTSKSYHAKEELPFPDVPPEVTSKTTITEQILEMKEWFKAFQNQDNSTRDYTKYFKPNLCYLEGAWTDISSSKKVDEPFHSDRHFTDAKTWMELHDKARFVAYSGSKSLLENLSYLPTKIIEVRNGTPIFAQWNYRIMCHPIKQKFSTTDLELVDDLSSRMMTAYNIYRHSMSRAARFQVKSKRDDPKKDDRPVSGRDLLDELMEEIPGKDNYIGHSFDEGLDTEVLNDDKTKKDVSRYHRWYKVNGKDAMGVSNIHRGYSDNYFFAAKTSQKKIAGMSIDKCTNAKKKTDCYALSQKWSYAIPLEIIFLTPLSKWNPYNLKYHGDAGKNSNATKNGRVGACDRKNKELDGIDSKHFYQTPHEFYSNETKEKTQADTARSFSCVLDQDGVSRKVRAAGTYQMLPYIEDIGLIRQRYPIYPVHGEGSSVWKEVNALREIVTDPKKWNALMSWDPEKYKTATDVRTKEFSMGLSAKTKHTHYFEMTKSELTRCIGGKGIFKTTSITNSHQHALEVRWNKKKLHFYYFKCDDKTTCFDNHDKPMKEENIPKKL